MPKPADPVGKHFAPVPDCGLQAISRKGDRLVEDVLYLPLGKTSGDPSTAYEPEHADS